jgi:hypothetical protein
MYNTISNNKIGNPHYPLTYSTSQNETTDTTTIKEKPFSKIILIVDDDPDVATVFSIGLEDEGFEVYSYNDPLHPAISVGCFIKKPVTIEYLVKRIKVELE